MAYFPPYIDDSGLHMPTYEDRLEALCESYRSIFGMDAELSESVPDYQLLSVFARALDDASALALSAYNSRNPQYASGQALDLLLPQYGLYRLSGETDAAARARIVKSLAGNGRSMVDNIAAEIRKITNNREVIVHVNDTDAADAQGVPAHSIHVIFDGGNMQKVAEAIFRKKPPGISTHGNYSRTVVDENGENHTVYLSIPATVFVTFTIAVTSYDGYTADVTDQMKNAVCDYVGSLGIGQSLMVPSVTGVCYAAAGDKASTFAITDVLATWPGGNTRIRVPVDWDGKVDCLLDSVRINVTAG